MFLVNVGDKYNDIVDASPDATWGFYSYIFEDSEIGFNSLLANNCAIADQLADQIHNNAANTVLVTCRAGQRRSPAVIGLYRIKHQNEDPGTILTHLRTFPFARTIDYKVENLLDTFGEKYGWIKQGRRGESKYSKKGDDSHDKGKRGRGSKKGTDTKSKRGRTKA